MLFFRLPGASSKYGTECPVVYHIKNDLFIIQIECTSVLECTIDSIHSRHLSDCGLSKSFIFIEFTQFELVFLSTIEFKFTVLTQSRNFLYTEWKFESGTYLGFFSCSISLSVLTFIKNILCFLRIFPQKFKFPVDVRLVLYRTVSTGVLAIQKHRIWQIFYIIFR